MSRILVVFILMTLLSCSSEKADFEVILGEQVGIDFQNTLNPDGDLNIFRYMYFYNGAGVGGGDFNNDGLLDLFFTSNQGANQLYLNQGDLQFKNATVEAGVPHNGGWSNGVSIVDINNDGLIDIYISQVGDFEVLKGKNQLLICTAVEYGVPKYEDKAAEYGLDLVGFGTQAAFVDFDSDGDLDFFQLNHSVHQNGTFGRRDLYLNQVHPLAGDRIFENVDGKFIEISAEAGIYQNALGYGLGLAFGDVNWDGKPDIYIGNDFHENDYLYINKGKLRFNDEVNERLNHTSRFSMGVDIADVNNDLAPEIVSLDMLPYDSEILKRSEGEDAFYNFEFKLKQGYNYQFARNNLQLNNGKGEFKEIGMLSGIYATDWSWSSLFADFNLDGNKDLFISNGISKRMNDTDYINFVSSDEIQRKIDKREFDESDESLVDLIPEIKIPNKIYYQKGDLRFKDIEDQIKNNPPSFSNGSIVCDLDNDGDLEIICNNINGAVTIYKNNAIQKGNKHFLKVQLSGSSENLSAIGTKCIVYSNGHSQLAEKFPVRGFQSSVDAPLHFGLENEADSILVIWPDNTFESFRPTARDTVIRVQYKKDLPFFSYSQSGEKWNTGFENVSTQLFSQLPTHVETRFNEFDREALIPAKMSTMGPAILVEDINSDGLDDIIIGGSRKTPVQVYTQSSEGSFSKVSASALEVDSLYEDIEILSFDANGDKLRDLLFISGGNEYLNKSEYNSPRLFIQKAEGGYEKLQGAFPNIYTTSSTALVTDFDGDGDGDVFIGSVTSPWSYGSEPTSYLMLNDGTGHFTMSEQNVFETLGMVKDASLVDIDADGDEDIVVVSEWAPVRVLKNESGAFSLETILDKKGLWNTLFIEDLNGDGLADILLGNHSLNSRLVASKVKPLKMYVNDMDGNGRLDQIITYDLNGTETIFADKKELEKQLPYIRKKYNFARDFARASVEEVFGSDKIKEAKLFEVDCLANMYLIQNKDGTFTAYEFPLLMQTSPIYNFQRMGDSWMGFGNFFDANIQLGRFDASKGYHFKFIDGGVEVLPELGVEGQVRNSAIIETSTGNYLLLGRNNESLVVLKKNKQ